MKHSTEYTIRYHILTCSMWTAGRNIFFSNRKRQLDALSRLVWMSFVLASKNYWLMEFSVWNVCFHTHQDPGLHCALSTSIPIPKPLLYMVVYIMVMHSFIIIIIIIFDATVVHGVNNQPKMYEMVSQIVSKKFANTYLLTNHQTAYVCGWIHQICVPFYL